MRVQRLRAYPAAGSQIAFARVATALAVVSVGALAVGALAIGRLAIKRLAPAGERVARAIGAVVVGTGLFLIGRAAGLG